MVLYNHNELIYQIYGLKAQKWPFFACNAVARKKMHFFKCFKQRVNSSDVKNVNSLNRDSILINNSFYRMKITQKVANIC